MAKLFPFLAVLILVNFSLTCSASTVHTVGDNSGWDISTDLDTWSKDNTFLVGDVLLFQYSSYHSVSEVTKENYEGCNTTNVLQSGSNGNTSFALTNPGHRYFVCGNKLHCLAGMKLHVNVLQDSAGGAPAASPEAVPGGGSLPPASTKSNNNPNSAAPVILSNYLVGLAALIMSFSVM
ncbi:hypothetical protein M9H77_10673 [Catharanthus roseus]|uniref:Uncharacterized protein n=1 Tax=Catharanthus roseus TaxID=4058 RepID=A0ACC0BCB2_CATRO|nr:hypothetical protein M9H77_10673 [Catharanthus roseus]